MVTIDLNIQAHRQQDRHTLVLTGELDLASAQELEGMVAQACADGAREIVLDLSRLRFIDSSGLKAILTARSLCATSGCELYLTPGQEPVQRLFEITRVIDRLQFRESSLTEPVDAGPESSTT
jgi:anti-sigma B factor antagonist